MKRQRQSEILILQRQKQQQRSLKSYDDLKNAKGHEIFSRQGYTESDFEGDDGDATDSDDNFDKYEDKEEEDDDDDDELDDSRSYGDPEIRPMRDDDDDDNKQIRDTGRIAASHETFTGSISTLLGLRIWTRWRTIYARNTSCLLREQAKRFNDE